MTLAKNPSPVAMPVFDLRRTPARQASGDAFLGNVLGVSHHRGWEFWRASGRDLLGRHESGGRHLVVIVLEGELTLRHDGGEIRLGAGEGAAIAPGQGFDWQTGGQASWIVNGYADRKPRESGAPGIQRIDRDAGQRFSTPPGGDVLVGPPPICTKLELAGSGDGAWSAGLWTATPYERIPVRYGYYEMMHLHAGAVTVFDAGGAEMTFRAGDVFLVAEGAQAGWRSTEDVRKLWSIFTPEPG